MKEINGTVEGFHFNGDVTGICTASSALKKCQTLHCTVIMVTVTRGKVVRGEKIVITINNRERIDTVCRIEKEKEEVPSAQEGDQIGICLSEVDIKDFNVN